MIGFFPKNLCKVDRIKSLSVKRKRLLQVLEKIINTQNTFVSLCNFKKKKKKLVLVLMELNHFFMLGGDEQQQKKR